MRVSPMKFFSTVLVIISALFFSNCAPKDYADGLDEPTAIVHLYPEGQDVDKGIVEDGVEITLGPAVSNGIDTVEFWWERDGSFNNVQDARLLLYLPKKHKDQMIVMCPGGGYGELTARGEGYYAAKELTRMGYPVAVLFYRLPNGHHQVPLTDVQNAFRYCRHHAAEWDVRQIGVMGASAGGHLAASASTLYTDSLTRPDFTVLLYAVTTFLEGKRIGAMKRITEGYKPELVEMFDCVKNVTPDTPPAAIFHAADDRGVPVEQSFRYHEALHAAGVQSELHVFPHGRHGWAFYTERTCGRDALGSSYAPLFFGLLQAFLDDVRPSEEPIPEA